MQTLSVFPSDIDVIILSHLHFDHAGGILKPYGQISTTEQHNPLQRLMFPNSHYIISQGALQRALNPHPRDRASYPKELITTIRALIEQKPKKVEILHQQSHSQILGKNFQFIETHGHTPHQLHTLYGGASHPIFMCSDLIPGTPWLHLPITAGYDRYPEQLIDEKSHILKRALHENWQLFYTHDPSTVVSKVIEDHNKRYVSSDVITMAHDGVTPIGE